MVNKFTPPQETELRHLRELALVYDVHIRRLVGLYAAENGVDLTKNTVNFDLDAMTYKVEPIKEDKKTDK